MAHNYRPLAKNNRGPRSRAGKAAVALANLEHGLAAAEIFLPTEDPAEWSRFHDDVLARFEPDGPIEAGLASRVAEVLWRLRRVARAEQQSVSVAQLRRDTLAADRDRPRHTAASPDAQPGSIAGDPARDATAGRAGLGFYADVLIADSVAGRYLDTLPVLLPDDRALELLIRYEAHLTRTLNHALHELEALQDRRNGNPTPLARIDIS